MRKLESFKYQLIALINQYFIFYTALSAVMRNLQENDGFAPHLVFSSYSSARLRDAGNREWRYVGSQFGQPKIWNSIDTHRLFV